jgi:hypothetical protein
LKCKKKKVYRLRDSQSTVFYRQLKHKDTLARPAQASNGILTTRILTPMDLNAERPSPAAHGFECLLNVGLRDCNGRRKVYVKVRNRSSDFP